MFPLIVGQWAVSADADAVERLGKVLTSPPGDGSEIARVVHELATREPKRWAALAPALAFAIVPLARNAVFVAGAEVLEHRAPSLVASYRAAFRRWLPQLVTGLVFAAFVLAGTLAVMLAGLASSVVIGVVAALVSRLVAVALTAIAAVAAVAGIVATGSFAYLTWNLASLRVATRESNPIRAVLAIVRLVLEPATRARTLRVALGLLGLEFVAAIALLVLTVLAVTTRAAAAPLLVIALGTALIEGLRALFVLEYARELGVWAP